jgi:glutamine amidotransferase
LFLDRLNDQLTHEVLSADAIASALRKMVKQVEDLKKERNISEMAYLNMVVSDGERLVAMRYVSNHATEEPLSLYYSEGSRYECEEGVCHMLPAEAENRSVMVVSEKLTDFATDWKAVPANHFVLVYKDLSTKLLAI